MTEVLEPSDWGWQLVDGKGLRPILTDKKYAPDELTKVIICKCKMTTKQIFVVFVSQTWTTMCEGLFALQWRGL